MQLILSIDCGRRYYKKCIIVIHRQPRLSMAVKNAHDLAKRMESSEANSWKIKSHITITVADFEISEHVDEFWNHATKAKFNYMEDTHPHNFNAGKYLFKYFTKPEYQDLFTKGERRYSSSRGVIPSRPVKTPSNAWEFMSIEHARNLAEAFNKDPFLEIPWKYEKDIDIDSLKLRYKIPLMVNDISIKHEV